jgi:hypothetical protein
MKPKTKQYFMHSDCVIAVIIEQYLPSNGTIALLWNLSGAVRGCGGKKWQPDKLTGPSGARGDRNIAQQNRRGLQL